MKIATLKDLLDHGHEIEFDYKGKRYSFTFGENEKGKIVIAFCEFYKDDIESEDIDEILNSTYNGMKVADIIEELDEKEVDIF